MLLQVQIRALYLFTVSSSRLRSFENMAPVLCFGMLFEERTLMGNGSSLMFAFQIERVTALNIFKVTVAMGITLGTQR